MNKEEKKAYLEGVAKKMQDSSENVSALLLKKCLDENINFFDLHYVDARAREIMEEALGEVLYRNLTVEKARLDFLKVTLKEMRKNFKVKNVEKPVDETELRDARCEDVAQYLAGLLTDESLILSDKEFIVKTIEEGNRGFLENFVSLYTDSLYSKMQMIIAEHERRANKKLWGKEREDISFEDLDEVLNRK